ncbi:MAG: DUF177 domain-containing protein [Marinosulfonomonas sp.]|nr:DUF177 domain-containing protein [Marinosulfonomonas sp.]
MENALQMTDKAQKSQKLRVAGLDTQKPTVFEMQPSAPKRSAIASDLDLLGLRKLRFTGSITATGDADWTLTADLGATVVQACVVTLVPVTTRIDVAVARQFVAAVTERGAELVDPDEEIEISPDDNSEPLGTHIDLAAVMTEALLLALPLYPKAEGANLEASTFTETGKTPMSDEAARPFAGLSALRDKLGKDE